MLLAKIVQLIIVRITKITEISRTDIILTFHYTFLSSLLQHNPSIALKHKKNPQ